MTGSTGSWLLLVVAAVDDRRGRSLVGLHGGTTITRSMACCFWSAAAVTLVGMAGGASRLVARRFDLPVIESWVFIAAAVALTGVGIVVDVLGS